MKLLCTSLFKNSWIPYWTKYLQQRKHKHYWVVGYDDKKVPEVIETAKKCDAVLCMWGSLWAKALLEADLKVPVYVIIRSFEYFRDTMVFGIESVPLQKARRVFSLNEAHYAYLQDIHPTVIPVYIKNGIDVDEWALVKRDKDALNRVAWICNLNFKKGVMMAVQAVHELKKLNKSITVEHIGDLNSRRLYTYIKYIMPHMHTQFYTYGSNNSHGFVQKFLENKGYILSCSMIEGHPMNVLEAMSTGCKPLIHRYPGVEYQFPDKYVWSTFDDLRRMHQERHNPEEYRQFIIDTYDYRISYKPVVDLIEGTA